MILDVAPDRAEALAEELEELGLQVHPHEFRRSTMACTGIEFCKLAIVDTKDTRPGAHRGDRGAPTRLRPPARDPRQRLPELVRPVPGRRHRPQGDAGPRRRREPVEGFQVHLGGSLGHAAGFGRKLRALKVTAAELPDYVDRLTGRYLEQRTEGEQFAEWVVRADEEDLR